MKPFLKEYVFEPSFTMVNVTDGKELNVVFSATRVAFSCIGRVTSLNGAAYPPTTIEAVSQGDDNAEHMLLSPCFE